MNTNPENLRFPITELLKGLPGYFGIRLEEEPRFYVIFKDHDFQIRKYRPFIIAETKVLGNFERAGEKGFKRLTSYLFGINSQNEKMTMSAPVFLSKGGKMSLTSHIEEEQKADSWIMSFILPAKYNMTTVPRPLEEGINVMKVPSLMVATLRFSGKTNEERIIEKQKQLMQWVENQRDYKVVSEPRYAQYDSPKVIPFFRRNEVQVTLIENFEKKKHAR